MNKRTNYLHITLNVPARPLAGLLAALVLALCSASAARAGGEEPPPPEEPPAPTYQLRAEGRFFRDPQGRAIILRGVNVAGNSKVPPFHGVSDLEELDPLADWGVNVIRLLFTWEAFEPAPGAYDWGYLDYIESIVDAAHARGIYTIIDIHQDGFARFLADGCGEGFPLWAVSPNANIDEPDNGHDCEDWATKVLLDPDMHLSFSDFYADAYGVRTRYLAMLDEVALNFAAHEGVIGYDLLNEPWGWEAAELLPLYEDAAEVVRSQDPDAILFIEPHASTNNGALPTTLPEPSFGNYAYAPHFYDVGLFLTRVYIGPSTATDIGFMNMDGKAAEWDVPLFVGEFGMFADVFNVGGYMDLLYKRLNENLASGAQWNYTPGWNVADKDGWNGEDLSIVDDSGNIRANYEVRPYAQKIAGTPTSLRVTDDSKSIELKWNNDPAAGVTELYVPRNLVWAGAQLKIEKSGSNLSCNFAGDNTKVHCTSTSTGAKTVKIRQCVMFFGSCL